MSSLTFVLLAFAGVAFMVLGIGRVAQWRHRKGVVVFSYGLTLTLFAVALRVMGLL